jgi:UDP-3-O-[3-hydroxymyristoyl] glucosamine N-acyltransferase
MNLSDLAAALGCELRGDGSIEITGVAGMEQAGPTEITSLHNSKYAPKAKHTRAAAILVKTRGHREDEQAVTRGPELI